MISDQPAWRLPNREEAVVEEHTLWSKITPAATGFAALTGNHETEIAVVGGGVAGLSLAYHLTEAGLCPAVLEAATPGSDAAGKSAGIVVSLPVRHSPFEILRRLGEEEGTRLVKLIGDSGAYVFALIRRLGFDCAPQQTGFLAPARTGQEVRRIRQVASEWRSLGYRIETLERDGINYLSGLDAYQGALLDPNGGTVNPLAYVRELARAAAGQGARIYIDSPVAAIRDNGNGWCLESEKFRLTAKQVVLCAGGGNRNLVARLAGTILPFRVFQVATEPVDSRVREVILPENNAMTDINPNIFSMRYDEDGRLITACPAFLFNNAGSRVVRYVEERLKNFSTLLASVRIRYLWQGTTWIGRSILPRFTRLSEGLFAVQACNGRGLAVNTMLGREAAGFIRQGHTGTSTLLLQKPDEFRCCGLMSHLPAVLVNSARLRSRVLHKLTGQRRYK